MSASTDISSFLAGLSEAERIIADQAVPEAVNKFSRHLIGVAADLAPVNKGYMVKGPPPARKFAKTAQPGFLKNSATVEPPVGTGDKVEQVSGFNAEYAAVQHERLDYTHEQGQAKYLETAVIAEKDKFPEFIQDEINRKLGR